MRLFSFLFLLHVVVAKLFSSSSQPKYYQSYIDDDTAKSTALFAGDVLDEWDQDELFTRNEPNNKVVPQAPKEPKEPKILSSSFDSAPLFPKKIPSYVCVICSLNYNTPAIEHVLTFHSLIQSFFFNVIFFNCDLL